MKRCSSRQIIALLLGVFLALGVSLSAVQASDMAFDMAMSSDMECCGDCASESDCDRNGGACLSVCTTTSPAVLPSAVTVKAAVALNMPLLDYQSTYGQASSPDPDPPRPHDQG